MRLKSNHVLHMVALSVLFECVFILITIGVSLYYSDGALIGLLATFATMAGLGGIALWISGLKPTDPSRRESFFSVVMVWFAISAFGMLPYLFTGAIPSVVDAFFETVSGFTTTGSSILNDIEALPKSLLFWRATTHFIGGMGIIVLVVAFLPFFKIGGQNMMMAEGSFFNTDKIKARSIDIAKRLWLIYVILVAAQTGLLKVAGMSWFDSVCHSFATVATGGFSTKNASLIEQTPLVQYIVIFFMIVSGINFTLHYLLFHGKIKKVWGNEELKTYLAIILVSSLIITVYIAPWGQLTWERAFRDSLFQVASIITATGFASADYQVWPQTAKMVILLVMLVGACAGSTGGGIKVARYVVIYKNFTQAMRRLVRPNSVQVARFNGQPISPEASAGILGFVFIYIMTIVVGSFIIMGTGLDYVSAFSSVITTLGGIGPGFNVVGPIANFSSLTDFAKIYLSFNMILGRLEIMTVLILLTPAFYRH